MPDDLDAQLKFQTVTLSALTQLAKREEGAVEIRKLNGIYTLSRLAIFPCYQGEAGNLQVHKGGIRMLQAHAFRCLRFIFNIEDNRRPFRR
jgi:NIMA (never in mitosis gene a)-related kinase